MPAHPRFCAQCGTGLSAGAAFCPSCGAAAGPSAAPGSNRAWVAAGVVITLSLLAIVWLMARRPAATPAASAPPTVEGLGYATGTIDQVAAVSSDTCGVGGRYFPRPRWGIEGNFDWQQRQDDVRYVTFTVIGYHHF